MNAKRQNSFFVFDNLLGESDWAQRIRRRVIQSSNHRFNALVTGPAGTGKRLIAQALHEHSPRRVFPFIPFDCALISGNLFQTQLFGCTYRETTSLGCLRSADGGTIYIENIDVLARESQTDLLRALEDRSVIPVGSHETYSFDARVIVGSRRNLEGEVKAGRFRADLYQRVSVLEFETTPLHSRPVDVAPIANHLTAKLTFERGLGMKLLSASALELLTAYQWPGNVSQLHRMLDEVVSTIEDRLIENYDLPIDTNDVRPTWPSLAEMEAKHIRETLSLAGGDTRLAATMLGIEPEELEFRIAQIDFDVS